MNINYRKYLTLCVCFATALLAACDPDGEQKFEFEPGTELMISGPAEINTLAPSHYYVNGYTIDYDYTWSLEGPDGTMVARYPGTETEDEYVTVTANAPGTYTLTVTRDGLSGTIDITATSVEQELSFETATSTVTENVDSIAVPVMISGRNLENTSVAFSVTGDNVTEGEDYTVLTESPLVFGEAVDEEGNPYREMSKNIFIRWLNNDLNRTEDPRTLTISLDEIVETGAGEAAVPITDSVALQTHTVIIEDDLKPVSFAAEQDVTIASVDEAGNYSFDIELSEAVTENVEIMYTIPTEFTDRGANIINETVGTGSVTIFAGETSGRIRVHIPESAVVDGEEYTIRLDSVVSGDEEVVIAEGSETATITVDFPEEEEEGGE